jgi:transmembrane sensor
LLQRLIPNGQSPKMRIETMDELICRAVNGHATDTEEALIEQWRREAPENERYFAALVGLLQETTAAAVDEMLEPPPTIDAIVPGIRSAPGSHESRFVSRWVSRRLLLTGSVGLAAGVAALLVLPQLRGGPSEADLVTNSPAPFNLGSGEVVTGARETATVTLGDGTIIRLAPESRLRVTALLGSREVWLEGRAFFAVVSQPEHPFTIRTHAGDAVVLGTRFDLQSREDDLRLLVIEGSVKLDAGGAVVEVEASQLAHAAASSPPVRQDVDAAFIESERRWMGNFLVFEGTPLGQAAQELSAHFGIPVRVLDGRLADETVRGVFVDETLEDVVRILCRAVSAYCSVRPSGVTIGP